ncbi:MAG: glycosyltransferase [Prevotellaceae bacterium]|jgi:dolichol-phosphate mannosyltransferase|nr:glycosyltransferase [Prevotellaceae bacterium]
MQLSVIIPCYNEEAVIAETHRQLTEVMKKLPHGYELIFVNDGSRDATLLILETTYIGNLFDEVKRRPEYIVSEKINFD